MQRLTLNELSNASDLNSNNPDPTVNSMEMLINHLRSLRIKDIMYGGVRGAIVKFKNKN